MAQLVEGIRRNGKLEITKKRISTKKARSIMSRFAIVSKGKTYRPYVEAKKKVSSMNMLNSKKKKSFGFFDIVLIGGIIFVIVKALNFLGSRLFS